MKYIKVLAVITLFLCGCKEKSQLPPCWDGKSVKDFKGKTMVSMVWIRPISGAAGPFSGNINSAFQVYKRFDGKDFKILLTFMESPELPTTRSTGGEYLYISFLDGSRWIVDFDIWKEKQYALLRNGQSKALYKLLTEKDITSEYDPMRDPMAHPFDPNKMANEL